MLQLRLRKIFGKRMGIQSDQPEIRLCGLFVLVYVNIQNFIVKILEKERKDFFNIRRNCDIFGFTGEKLLVGDVFLCGNGIQIL